MSKKIKTAYLIIVFSVAAALIAGVFLYRNFFKEESREEVIAKLHEKYFYLNLYDSVKYVGDEKCKSCHLEIHSDFLRTGMGKSLYKPSSDNEIEDFSKTVEVYDPKSNFYYTVYREGDKYFQMEFRKNKNGEITHELVRKIDYVIGSGNSTRSYLYEENGFFYELPVTWFTEKAKWDLSPGYQKHNLRFSRPIVEECMNCHNSYSGHVKFSDNKFNVPIPEGISCERCHGPGELHLLRHTKENTRLFEGIEIDTIDRTIVNPSDLPLNEQLSVCFQCHLQGDVRVFADGKEQSDFMPGMKLQDIKTVFVQDNIQKGDFKIASHAARMSLSECFIKSDGGLTCITCHDPHISVKEMKREFFNGKCTGCHAVSSLSSSTPKADHSQNSDCVSCHMRQGSTADVLHVNFTDHWIRKEIDVKDKLKFNEQESVSAPIVLKNFNNPDDKYAEMNLAIAYVTYYEVKHPHQEYLRRAIPLLEENLKKFPEHKSGQLYLGIAYYNNGNITSSINTLEKLAASDEGNAEAFYRLGLAYDKGNNLLKSIESYNRSLSLFPEKLSALHNLGNALSKAGKIAEAIETYKKAINLVSNNPAVLNNLGDVTLYNLQMVDIAKEYFQKALNLDPDFTPALNNLGNAFMISGNTNEAEKIFKEVIEKEPTNVLAYGNLAVIYEDRNEIGKAIEMLEKVLKIDPNDIRAKQMLAKLKMS